MQGKLLIAFRSFAVYGAKFTLQSDRGRPWRLHPTVPIAPRVPLLPLRMKPKRHCRSSLTAYSSFLF